MKLVILALLSALAFGQGNTTEVPVCTVALGPDHGPCIDPDTRIVLIGGELANMADWPNSVWKGNCTSTVVGERVLATAAHCVSNGGTASFIKGANRYSGRCTHHPEYRRNSTADFALCVLSTTVEGGEYEKLNTNSLLAVLGTKPTLQGYGCRRWGGGLDGKMRIGQAPIVQLPKGTNYDYVTRGTVALCSGDSGGASFLPTVEDGDVLRGDRVVMGVNSRSNTTTTSYMPGWHADSVMAWGKSWAVANNVTICGYNEDAVGCRSVVPPVPNKFIVENEFIAVSGALKKGHESLLEQAKALVIEAVGKLKP